MTDRQAAILSYIRHCEQHGEPPPTIREIMNELDISSGSVSSTLDKLQRDGYITRVRESSRGIRLTDKGRMVNSGQDNNLPFDKAQPVLSTIEGDVLAKVEAIRLRARRDILALGFSENEAAVDVSLFGINEMGIFHLAKELGWTATQSWYEPPAKTEGGDITIYYEPEEQVW